MIELHFLKSIACLAISDNRKGTLLLKLNKPVRFIFLARISLNVRRRNNDNIAPILFDVLLTLRQ